MYKLIHIFLLLFFLQINNKIANITTTETTTVNRSPDKEDETIYTEREIAHTQTTTNDQNHDDNIENYDEINCEYRCNIFHQNASDA